MSQITGSNLSQFYVALADLRDRKDIRLLPALKLRLLTGLSCGPRENGIEQWKGQNPKSKGGTQFLLTYAKSKLMTIPIVLEALVLVPIT